jgi:hypothetical protein
VIFAILASALSHAKDVKHQIWSNVEYNEEGGDLLGIELDVTITGSRIDGTLKVYQGACAGPIRVTGSLSGNDVHLSGRSDVYGRTEITGRVSGGRMSGSLRLEKGQSPEKIRLKTIAKPHC